MKKARKLFALLISVVLMLSLSVASFAAGDGGKITLTNPKEGETYNLYKLLDFTWDGESAYSYSLPAGSPWESFFTTGAGATYFSFDAATRTVEPKEALGTTDDGANVKAFADAAMTFLAAQVPSITPTATKTATDVNGSLVFDHLDYGYYMLDTTMGTVCVLSSNSSDLFVTDKALIPTLNKQAQEDDEVGTESNGWREDYVSAQIGQSVNFRTFINNIYLSENVVYHDKMSNGLTLDADSIVVSMMANATATPAALTADTDYTLTTEDLDDDCTFEIALSDTYLHSLLSADAYIVVTYSATLNENAVVSDPTDEEFAVNAGGNSNDAQLTYGANQKTTWDVVRVHTWPVKVFKYTGTGSDDEIIKTPLAGAKFALAKVVVDGTTEKWQFLTAVDDNNKVSAWGDPVDRDSAVPEDAEIFESTADSTDLIEIYGLDAFDTYLLIETEAPAGYTQLTEPISFSVNEETSEEYSIGYIRIGTQQMTRIDVENKSGSILPSTGGIGTTLLYTVGGIMVLGAVILLVTKKRMSDKK